MAKTMNELAHKSPLIITKRHLESISETAAAASQIPEFNIVSEEQRPPREARTERIRKYAFSAKR